MRVMHVFSLFEVGTGVGGEVGTPATKMDFLSK